MTAELEEVGEEDSSETVEATADSAESSTSNEKMTQTQPHLFSPEHSGHEEAREAGDVPHQLHDEQGHYLVLGGNLPSLQRVAIRVEREDDHPGVTTDHNQSQGEDCVEPERGHHLRLLLHRGVSLNHCLVKKEKL